MRAHSRPFRSPFDLLLALTVTLGLQIYLWPHVTDDAYISFRYAFHLATGQGLVFNPGEAVEGFSNPLWTLLLAGLYSITHWDIPLLARSLGLLSALATIFVMWWVHRSFFQSQRVSAMGLLFVMLAPGFHVYATAGLEGILFSFLLVVGIALSIKPQQPSYLAAFVFGLVGITRPEGPLYALLWFLASMPLNGEKTKKMWTREAMRFSTMIIPVAAWQIFRLVYYGAWLPNTAVAKISGVFGEFINFPEYVAPWIIAVGGPFLLLLWLVLPPAETLTRRLERMCVSVSAATVIFVIYARGDWMTFGRFIVPIWPVMGIIIPLWLQTGIQRLSETADLRFRKLLFILPFIGILACSYLAWHSSVGEYVRNERMNMLMRGTDQVAVGRWISTNISASATVATGRLGGISYGAMANVVWDWFGLTDAEEASYIRQGRPGRIENDPVFRRHPDVIAAIEAPANWSYTRTSQLMDYLHRDYVFVIGFPQGTYGYVDIWIRKDRIDDVFLTRSEYVLPQE